MVLLVLVLTLSFTTGTFSASQAHAAPLPHANQTTPKSTILYFWTSFSHEHVHTTVYFELDWNSGPGCCLGLTAYYGDGGSDNATCWVNCGSGSQLFAHFYNHTGTFRAYGDSSAGGPSNTISVFIS